MKKIAIMQPYFFPYIGYFQLLNAVDEFIIYDNIKYTKRGWINRNRILVNGKDEFISLPLKKDSDYLNVNERYLSDTWEKDRIKLLNKIKEAYKKAPYFNETYLLIEKCLIYNEQNLFNFILNSIRLIKEFLGINTKITISSDIEIDHNLKAEEKVMAICSAKGATHYINPIGGVELYNKQIFKSKNLKLNFLKTTPFTYNQFQNEFIPFLSIIDVIMFNKKEVTINSINKNYSLI